MQMIARLCQFALLALLAGCGGDSAFDRDNGRHPLTGSWSGNFDADITSTGAGFKTVQFLIDRGGRIDSLQFDGTGQILTGSPAGSSSGLFDYALSDGRTVSIYLDTDGEHFAFVVDGDSVGVVEATPAEPPPFENDDIDNNYIGTEYAFATGYLVADFDTSVAVGDNPAMGDPTFDSRLDDAPNCDVSGTLTGGVDVSYGVFENGTYTESTGNPGCIASGELKVYLSPDANFLLAVTCESFAGTVPDACRFGFYERP